MKFTLAIAAASLATAVSAGSWAPTSKTSVWASGRPSHTVTRSSNGTIPYPTGKSNSTVPASGTGKPGKPTITTSASVQTTAPVSPTNPPYQGGAGVMEAGAGLTLMGLVAAGALLL